MAKYSTGDSSGDGGGGACELCGEAADSLTEASVAGAQLLVCGDCASHNDNAHADEKRRKKDRGGEQNRKRKAAQNAAKASGAFDGDSTHWEEEGTDYDDDPLPYLVSGYGERLEEARQDAGMQRDELADAVDATENDVLAVEQNRANQAGVGGGLIERLEDRLDVELAE